VSTHLDTNKPGQTSSRKLMSRLVRENVVNYKWPLAVAVVFMAIFAAATSYSAFLMEDVVNDVFISQDRDMLFIVGGAIVATFLAKGIANYAQSVIMSFIGMRIVADLQNRLYAHMANMDLAFFHKHQTGTLISRFTVDVQIIRGAVSNTLTSLGKDVMSLIGLVSVMIAQDAFLAAIALVVFPIAIYPIVRLGKRTRKVVANTQKETGLLTALLGQTFQGIRVVKAYSMQAYEGGRIKEIIERTFKLNMKAVKIQALSSPIMETLGGFAVALVVVYGGSRVMNGQTDAGSFFSFITALLMAYEPMKRLAKLNSGLQTGLAGAERMYQVLDTLPDINEKPDARDLEVKHGHIQIKDVTFRYDDDVPALHDLSIDVPAGKTVALVGPSGAGKSTVFNIIPRFYDIESGSVTIDGMDVRDSTFASLHGSIALVSQEITLFDDTVRANIAYGRAGASEEDIEAAARNAAAHEFIMELPEGYDTAVGEQGLKLSGGQRQRLAIARAMLKNAPILLLDEATSALDTESERQVQSALDHLLQGRTALVIAHRLSTIVNADLIYVINEGKITESGSHSELMTMQGHYATLYDMQFREEEQGESSQ
jgi:ATP-binding cassette, subfamily B, bacterial MsbA